uniref:DNA primase large subunit n=1 Tax=Lygus hesperus TaxID=30085 RepID=A0A0A9WEP8_LYGHE
MKRSALEQFLTSHVEFLCRQGVCHATPETVRGTVSQVLEFQQNHSYQVACTAFFQLCHGTANSNVIRHPNAYFSDAFTAAVPDTQPSLPCSVSRAHDTQLQSQKRSTLPTLDAGLCNGVNPTASNCTSTASRTPMKQLYGTTGSSSRFSN